MKNDSKSICILRLSALGDCINAFGLVNALHKSNKDIEVNFVIDKRFSSLFIKEDGTSIVPLTPVDIKKNGLLKSFFKLKKQLSNHKYDALFNLQTSIKASLLSTAIRASVKLGYDKDRRRECQNLFINKEVVSPKDPHVLAGFLEFAHQSGFDDLTPCWDYDLSKQEIERAKTLVLNSQRIFTISPCSAKAIKNWTIDGYTAIAKHAIEKGFKVVLIGSPNPIEMQICSILQENLGDNVINLCGKTSLRELAAVISLSKLVLSPDSAAMHLASSLQVPVISLYAIHDPKRVGSWYFKDLQISVYDQLCQKELDGKELNWRYRVKDPNAMKNISIEQVVNTFDYAIDKYQI